MYLWHTIEIGKEVLHSLVHGGPNAFNNLVIDASSVIEGPLEDVLLDLFDFISSLFLRDNFIVCFVFEVFKAPADVCYQFHYKISQAFVADRVHY